ncbi:hypothetical protein PoB_003246700 [Plakobranchus ocellatus]|uniref:Secreted protein n=1 Tax=Plakobranchus ocellatus TaxID=259542 RepID=A0AAV4AFE8_9GAST|nr:hypothetical protein PoB_003246700 [Plakobranchus ocellatus]
MFRWKPVLVIILISFQNRGCVLIPVFRSPFGSALMVGANQPHNSVQLSHKVAIHFATLKPRVFEETPSLQVSASGIQTGSPKTRTRQAKPLCHTPAILECHICPGNHN